VWTLIGALVLAVIIGASSAVLAYNTGDATRMACTFLAEDERFQQLYASCKTATIAVGIRNGAAAALIGGLVVLILARRKTA
jgi:hypothetical protein